jgi:hypothetical protein
MPPVSQAQRRWAYATEKGETSAPPSVGKEFLGHGITGLPARAASADEAVKQGIANAAKVGAKGGKQIVRSKGSY